MKYLVNIGGFVSTYREEDIIVEADNYGEAKIKAELLFIDHLQEEKAGNMCDEGFINDIKEIE